MNGDIERMVSGHLVSTKIMVEGKAETADRPVKPDRFRIRFEKCFDDGFRGQVRQPQFSAIEDVIPIIKHELSLQGVPVYDQ